jgi:NAD(P)-dependent dehydrogenase (short-subunit alcohol dehydrogenase family)
MSNNLQGQVAVVTGASKGSGSAIAEHLAAAGAAVVVSYPSSRAGAEAVVKRIRQADGKAVAVQADVSKLEDVRRLFAETRKAFGKLDILVNNAGVYEFAPLEAVSAEHFHKQFDVNVLGLLRLPGGSLRRDEVASTLHHSRAKPRPVKHKAKLSDPRARSGLKLGLGTFRAEIRTPYRSAPSGILPFRDFFFQSVATTSSPGA